MGRAPDLWSKPPCGRCSRAWSSGVEDRGGRHGICRFLSHVLLCSTDLFPCFNHRREWGMQKGTSGYWPMARKPRHAELGHPGPQLSGK